MAVSGAETGNGGGGMRAKTHILAQQGDWTIKRSGIHYVGTPPYVIAPEQFWNNDWIRHMDAKTWVNLEDFTAIFQLAKEMERNGVLRPRRRRSR